jgi:hypothetical protein
LSDAQAAEGLAMGAKTHAEDVAKAAHGAHQAATTAMEAANHASH